MDTNLDFAIQILNLFKYKVIFDEKGNNYVLLYSNPLNVVEGITDKTAFEALENHVHLIDKIRKRNINDVVLFGKKLGYTLAENLKAAFPDKNFVVFVTITNELIIRFHQKWFDEAEYYDEHTDGILLRFEAGEVV